MQNRVITSLLVLITVIYTASININAQNVVQRGRQFIEQRDSTRCDSTSGYTFVDKNNIEYPIFISNSGKAYIIKTSKNGKKYRRYLKDVTTILYSQSK